MLDPKHIEWLPLPTVDRPFIIHLWPIFNWAVAIITGRPADDFRLDIPKTPLSGLGSTLSLIGVYYLTLLAGSKLMRNREPFGLKTVFLAHNLYLTAISAILLLLFIEQVVPQLFRHGLFRTLCHLNRGWTQPLTFLYYVCNPKMFTDTLMLPNLLT